MSKDGLYVVKSQGWRYDDVQGWTVCRKEPGMAVRRCPGMDRMPRRAMDGGAAMSRDGLYAD